jgi:hypothetical protein
MLHQKTPPSGRKTPWLLHNGDLFKDGKLSSRQCSRVELIEVEVLTWASWATGNNGFEWDMWPEQDSVKISYAINNCWNTMLLGIEQDPGSRPIAQIVARRVCFSLFFDNNKYTINTG